MPSDDEFFDAHSPGLDHHQSSIEHKFIHDQMKWPPTNLPPNDLTIECEMVNKCALGNARSPSELYLQIGKNEDRAYRLQRDCAVIYKTKYPDMQILPMQMISAGVLCVAPYDKDWYRARILEINDSLSQANVHFVDWGNDDWIAYNLLKPIHPKLLGLPVCATRCCLKDVDKDEAFNWDDFSKSDKVLWKQQMLQQTSLGVDMIAHGIINNLYVVSLFHRRSSDDVLKLILVNMEQAKITSERYDWSLKNPMLPDGMTFDDCERLNDENPLDALLSGVYMDDGVDEDDDVVKVKLPKKKILSVKEQRRRLKEKEERERGKNKPKFIPLRGRLPSVADSEHSRNEIKKETQPKKQQFKHINKFVHGNHQKPSSVSWVEVWFINIVSPAEFYVRTAKVLRAHQKMIKKLKDRYSSDTEAAPSTKFRPGFGCVFFDENADVDSEQRFMRAEIDSFLEEGSGVCIRCIDYGYYIEVKRNNYACLKQLYEGCDSPGNVFRVAAWKLVETDEFTDDEVAVFKETMHGSKVVDGKFQHPSIVFGKKVFMIELFDHELGTNLIKQFTKECRKLYEEEPETETGRATLPDVPTKVVAMVPRIALCSNEDDEFVGAETHGADVFYDIPTDQYGDPLPVHKDKMRKRNESSVSTQDTTAVAVEKVSEWLQVQPVGPAGVASDNEGPNSGNRPSPLPTAFASDVVATAVHTEPLTWFYVTEMKSAIEFYIQVEVQRKAGYKLAVSLNQLIPSQIEIASYNAVTRGDWVAAQYVGTFYRALVLDKQYIRNQPMVHVQFIDYGNKIWCGLPELRILDPLFHRREPLVYRVHLHGFSLEDTNSDNDATFESFIRELVDTSGECKFLGKFLGDEETTGLSAYPIQLFTLQNQDLSDLFRARLINQVVAGTPEFNGRVIKPNINVLP